jgi:ribosomal protein L11 methyltransferase
VLSVSPVVSRDWSEAWKRDLGPIVVSPRLVVRPSFASHAALPEQRVLVIDPGQAFGTGAHESTRLALEAIDALAEERLGASLLDVGTGSGVLALAGLALGCAEAVGFDLDPLAGQAARENARHNRLDAHLGLFVGGLAALAPGRRFDWIAANLLLSELRPLLAPMAAHLAGDGVLVLSGLLAEQAPEVRERAAALGFREEQTLRRADASGAMWVALVMCREGAGPRR